MKPTSCCKMVVTKFTLLPYSFIWHYIKLQTMNTSILELSCFVDIFLHSTACIVYKYVYHILRHAWLCISIFHVYYWLHIGSYLVFLFQCDIVRHKRLKIANEFQFTCVNLSVSDWSNQVLFAIAYCTHSTFSVVQCKSIELLVTESGFATIHFLKA